MPNVDIFSIRPPKNNEVVIFNHILNGQFDPTGHGVAEYQIRR